jgi:hypothetical protein
MASAVAPGTIYRIYKDAVAQSGPHYTAVLMKDGRIYEVKNPDTSVKTIFDSLAAWCEARGVATEAVSVTTKKMLETVDKAGLETVDRGGFNVPRYKGKVSRLFNYYYDTLATADPKLLEKEEVKTAYNNLVGACSKYIKHMSLYASYNRDDMRYSQPSTYHKWGDFPVFFDVEGRWGFYTPGYGAKPSFDCDAARAEIVPAYKALYDLIAPTINAYRMKVRVKKYAARSIVRCTRLIEKAERARARVSARYDWQIAEYRKEVEKARKTLAEE